MIKLLMKTGGIFLILLLVLSTSGFILVKTISANQPIDPSIYEQKSIALSAHMGDPAKWRVYQNQPYGYQIKHPDSWDTQENKRTSFNTVSSYEAYLGSRIKLTVAIHSSYSIPKSAPRIKIGDIDFYILTDNGGLKSAVVPKDNLYYKIDLEANNFFENSTDFRGTFYTILKNFQFTT
jgi:hypothetical protein